MVPTILTSRDNNYATLCSYNVVENDANFVLECLIYNFIEDKFQSLFEDVLLRSFKSGFQLDYQVDISLHFMDEIVVRHSRETSGLI
jgi:hypothetical protein